MYCILIDKPNNNKIKIHYNNTAHSCCDGYFTSISACGVSEARVEVQVFRKELYTHIHLDQVRVEFLSCKKKKKKEENTTIQYYNKLFDLFGVGFAVYGRKKKSTIQN